MFFLREDSLIEWATFTFYFIASIISFKIAIKFFANKFYFFSFLYSILTIGLFFVAMEEISWGQRIFNISTPDAMLTSNYQGEMNVHNLEWFPLHTLYIIVGLYGAFFRLLIPRMVKFKHKNIIDFLAPNYYLFFYFFVVGVLYLYYDYISQYAAKVFGDWVGWGEGHFIDGKDQEPAEFLLSLGFLLFVAINNKREMKANFTLKEIWHNFRPHCDNAFPPSRFR
jgi:hypothetical protein